MVPWSAVLISAAVAWGQETKPVLRVSPPALTFQCQGAGDAKQTLAVSLSAGSLAFTASTSTGWISVEPSGGAAGKTPATLQVGVQCASAQGGGPGGSVLIAAAGTENGAVTIPVRVQTRPTADLRVLNSYVALTGQAGMGAASQPVSLASTTGEPVAFQATASAFGGNWLSVSPTSGTAPASLNVSANLAGLSPGNYSGTVTVSWGGGRSAAIAVTLTVTP